jgi:hypothetical protein
LDNTYQFPNYQKIFQHLKTNGGLYAGYNEQLQQTSTVRFVDFGQDKALFRKFPDVFEALYE